MAVRVKICGLTRPEDIAAAVEAGADSLGFVFEKSSPRYVGDIWPELQRSIPPYIYRVAVFGPAPEEYPEGVHAVQAIWSLEPKPIRGIDMIQCVRIGGSETSIAESDRESGFQAILLDAYDPNRFGGTGKTVDWELARRLIENSALPVALAGGLTPENVREAIEATMPFAVDVSSGIEIAPGVKSAELIWKFVENARKARLSGV